MKKALLLHGVLDSFEHCKYGLRSIKTVLEAYLDLTNSIIHNTNQHSLVSLFNRIQRRSFSSSIFAMAQFILYTHAGPGPNPVKVAMALEHLGLDYECVPLDLYDPSGKLAGNTAEDCATVNQWLAWQVSGLGPYQGQLVWFLNFHKGAHDEEPNDSVIARYQAEVEHLRSVLEKHLASAENGFVALGRLSIADFAILPWLKTSVLAGSALKPFEEYPAIEAYIKKLDAPPEVQAACKKAVPPKL
ncbi:hypothetical protein CDV55_106021 [Aspergillus turcosus]|uniref:GST C-terminal domain-containing protein n=1 Tax=Aspergillus turcosus TaxID=1245748 RepID=A0A397HPY3_9EURO|nr:hypothetical protein CDV55_106021 [Aspergillus turcosus]RLL98411.1 hypothetical protein CFD26_106241 [Aspergillus turcosus]